MTWDFSIYPELRPDQQEIVREIGLTLLGVQAAENALQFCLTWIFAPETARTWQQVAQMDPLDRRKTLGQLVSALRTRAEVHPELDSRLDAFVDKRNKFIHGIFNTSEYMLDSKECVARAHSFLVDLQADSWDMQTVFMGYNLAMAKVLGISLEIMAAAPEHAQKHFDQVSRAFSNVLGFKDKKGRTRGSCLS